MLIVAVLLMKRSSGGAQEGNASGADPVSEAEAEPAEEEAPISARSKSNVLEGVSGDVKGRTYFVGQRTVTLGRGQTNFIQTTDEAASRTHCRLKPTDKGLMVSDMESTNGVKVNGEPVEGAHLLVDGDLFSVGEAGFVYHRHREIEEDAAKSRKRVGKFVAQPTVQGEWK